MASQRWVLAVCFSLASVLGTGESFTTTQTQKYTCRTFGSGVFQPFKGWSFYLRSDCEFTLTHFTHKDVECDITARRDESGLLVQVEIIINKIRTVIQNGGILVEKKSVSLPYAHTYQRIFQYGIYTKLKSSLLPLSVTWHNVPGGIDTLRVELEQELSTDITGLCGNHTESGNKHQLIAENILSDGTCNTRDPSSTRNPVCQEFLSYTMECLRFQAHHYHVLCNENIYEHEGDKYIGCAFFNEVVQQCGKDSIAWREWRRVTGCEEPDCPGDLVYVAQGPAFGPSCSNPNPRLSDQELTSSCACPKGKVLNDRAEGFHCVNVSGCVCVFAGKNYSTGDERESKCQTCICDSGAWRCSGHFLPSRCVIEGPYVTTFDGKQFDLPGKCTYVASKGTNWQILIEFSDTAPSLNRVMLWFLNKDTVTDVVYVFSHNSVKIGEKVITGPHKSEYAQVFWRSSMYVEVHTSFGMKVHVQVSPEIQLYITPSRDDTGSLTGLCGNSNNDTTDDFTTEAGIIENSAQPFALSWSVAGTVDCSVDILPCSDTSKEIHAEEMCSVLNDATGIFGKCHDHIQTEQYHKTCISRTCRCEGSMQQCLCVALESYAKACARLGVEVGDWRKATKCAVTCPKNQVFSYNVQACNHTCRSLSGHYHDPCCGLHDGPVEGCSCPEGTHLNHGNICTPKEECNCYYNGGTTPPGSVTIDGKHCNCTNGELSCEPCECSNGKVCVQCSEKKTCASLSKPMGTNMTCKSGCYCPNGLYEDHNGNCVQLDNCTCLFSGSVFSSGQRVKTKCQSCTCNQGQWHCQGEPCPGKCQVYGNGHYQTFDSKWYKFVGDCQYTLVEDDCGTGNGTFSVRMESVPCFDAALTCARSIIFELQGIVTLTLSDMKVTSHHYDGWTLPGNYPYSAHEEGLYIVISVPTKGITLIWDRHTRITIELQKRWRNKVCGQCGNFDSNEMNDLQISGPGGVSSALAFGNSWKASTPPCSDVTTEMFPCERNSYCLSGAQRRCLILKGDTFKDCHSKVDPEPYLSACVLESCSCEFEGKFLGFCTAVAAYAEACSDQDVCVNWRTPEMCPVYCDYYNKKGQCRWHYEACGEVLTCQGYDTHKLEGCYPRCPKEKPYYDENTGECTKLSNCTCYFNGSIVPPGQEVVKRCRCENGTVECPIPTDRTDSTTPVYSTTPMTTIPASTTTEYWSTTSMAITTPGTTIPSTTAASTTTEYWSTTPVENTTPGTTIRSTTAATTTTESTTPVDTTIPITTIPSSTAASTTTEYWSTTPIDITTPEKIITSTTAASTTTEYWSTTPVENTTPGTTIRSTAAATTTTESTTPVDTTIPITTIPSSTAASTTTEYWSTTPVEITTPEKIITASTTTEYLLTMPIKKNTTPGTTIPSTTAASTTTEYWSTTPVENTTPGTTTTVCECEDLRNKKTRSCGETWSNDCFNGICKNGAIVLTQEVCPVLPKPICPRPELSKSSTKVSAGCCETEECNCICEVYGDPHYISFEGLSFSFMGECTYILVEERSQRHHLTIAVDNVACGFIPGGSCTRGIILKYQNNTATLRIIPENMTVQATLNDVIIEPPYEEHGLSFQTTGYMVSIYLHEIRSYVSLTPYNTLTVSLAMQHFFNNTQGQCGICGGSSCVRKGGHIEEDSCCDKTAYDWLYNDSRKPACSSAPRDVPCNTPTPPTPRSTTSPCCDVCDLLLEPVFSNCGSYEDRLIKKRSCEFDCDRTGPCSTLEQAASECPKPGCCLDWRNLTNGCCDLPCPNGLVYRECPDKLDDYCNEGIRMRGASLDTYSPGCFCPSGMLRLGNHSDICVPECPCYQNCAPRMSSVVVSMDNCTTVMQMPVCQGPCLFQRVLLQTDPQVEQTICAELSSERRPVTVQCSDRTTRQYTYKHITSCGCTAH